MIGNEIMRWLILICGFVLFGFGVFLATEDKIEGAMTTYGAASICLIFAFLARFKKFKGPGIEAELWEGKMEEAKEVIKSLQSLSVAVSKPIISSITLMGRGDSSMSKRDKYKFVGQLEKILRDHDIPEDIIEESLKDWHRINTRDLAALVLGPISTYLSEKMSPLITKIEDYSKPINPSDPEYIKLDENLRRMEEATRNIQQIYSLDTPENILKGFEDVLNDPVVFSDGGRKEFLDIHKEKIEDLRFYVNNKKLRRLEHWLGQGKEE